MTIESALNRIATALERIADTRQQADAAEVETVVAEAANVAQVVTLASAQPQPPEATKQDVQHALATVSKAGDQHRQWAMRTVATAAGKRTEDRPTINDIDESQYTSLVHQCTQYMSEHGIAAKEAA